MGRQPQAQREHVRVVPLPRAVRRLRVDTQRRPNARDLVRRDRGAGTRPAGDHSLVGPPFCDVARGRLARPRPVGALRVGRVHAVGNQLVASPAELIRDRVRDARQLVRGDRDSHRAWFRRRRRPARARARRSRPRALGRRAMRGRTPACPRSAARARGPCRSARTRPAAAPPGYVWRSTTPSSSRARSRSDSVRGLIP